MSAEKWEPCIAFVSFFELTSCDSRRTKITTCSRFHLIGIYASHCRQHELLIKCLTHTALHSPCVYENITPGLSKCNRYSCSHSISYSFHVYKEISSPVILVRIIFLRLIAFRESDRESSISGSNSRLVSSSGPVILARIS